MAMFHLTPANAVDTRQYFTLYTESRKTDPAVDVGTTEVSGIGFEWRDGSYSSIFYAGLSAGKMTSDQIISSFGDRNIAYPVFFYFGFNMPMAITPYIEYGVELAAVIVHDTLEDEESYIDTYLAGGVAIQTKAVLLKFYAKEHKIKPYLFPEVEIYVTGFSVGFEF